MSNDKEKENSVDNSEKMKWALEDIENYAFKILETAEGLNALVDALALLPEDQGGQLLTTTKGMQKGYATIANDLLRSTNRGLGK